MKTSFVQFLAQSIKRACGKGSGMDPKSNVPTTARNAKSLPAKAKGQLPQQKVLVLIQRGENLRDECSKVSATINPSDVSSWERESRAFIDHNQTADEQAIAERVSRVPINAASLPAPRDGYFVTIVHTLQHLNIISKRLNGSNPTTGNPDTA
jgi:hypothetical protein